MSHTSPTRKEIVLIVEDDLLIRMVVAGVLQDAGFNVLEANNADEAIHLLELHSDICIIFTNIEMPGSIDGLKLAASVRRRWPPIKIVVTSARCELGASDLPENCLFIPKPYELGQVVATLREVLSP